ncbi:MAG: hypothetical protein GKR93_06830 [Gammaproteobacteria bacterium]|nr:hypothetical protein [Gammaproteobacteria bacterium]
MSADNRPSTVAAERILVLSGVTYVFLAMVLGVLFAFVVSHVANSGMKEAWTGIMAAVAIGDSTTVREQFAVIADLSAMRGRIMNSHSHIGASGLLALLLAALLPLTSLSRNTLRLLAWSVVSAVILQFAGVLCAYYFDFQAIYLADLGATILFAGVAIVLCGLLRRGEGAGDLTTYVQSRLNSPASRLLLKAGVTLLLLGMLLGSYLAWLIVSGEETQSLSAVAQSVEHLMEKDVSAAQSAIANFKFTQAKSGINAAAHSHGPVLALFMLLLALLRHRINLGERFFRLFSIAFATLSFALPLWIFLAINFWFNFRFFANYTGVLLACLTLVVIYGAARSKAENNDAAGEEA